ncbi:MAG: protein kinase domain-containing protein [Bryobacteraceae bacterium]
MSAPTTIQSRYEVQEVIAHGGMGVVYKAFDAVMKRTVALKALLDIADTNALQLFQAECEVLASLIHPNIVEIYDIGQFEDSEGVKPYLVMPLLPGVTLDRLIKTSSQRLTVERTVDIICQVCRGLQAAHERGLVHRDIKPSNIFVLEDDSTKIIDFGIARRMDAATRTRSMKGTLLYMAPEQLEMKPVSALSDVFSLGVVCYETLTRRRPFERPTEEAVVDAVLNFVPLPASELNPAVNAALSQAIHKAMAKQPRHRYSSAREFGETLQKAARNDPIEIFNPARVRPRVQRATDYYEMGDLQFASEILGELEAEGHLDPAINDLRQQIDAKMRERKIRQLLEDARARMEEDEYPLALSKIEEVLQLEAQNPEALNLKSKIENRRTERDQKDWVRLAQQHIDARQYSHARDALQRILQQRPTEARATQLLAEVDRLEREYLRLKQEKEQFYKAALEAEGRGEISSALSKLERVLELDRQAPEITAVGRSTNYQKLFNRVRSERDAIKEAYADAQRHLGQGNFQAALSICKAQVDKYPGNALFQALQFDIEEQQRQAFAERIVDTDREVEAEPDLRRRVSILDEAVRANPGEAHFEQALKRAREKSDQVDSIVARARSAEENGQFGEAMAQWETLQTIHGRYPGLNLEIEHLKKRRDQHSMLEEKGRRVEQVDYYLGIGDYCRAQEVAIQALQEFSGDVELVELEKLAKQGLEREAEAKRLSEQGQRECAVGNHEAGLADLRQARKLDERNGAIHDALLENLVEQARRLMDENSAGAEAYLKEALELEPEHALVKGLLNMFRDRKREEEIERLVSQVRQLQAEGDVHAAMKAIRAGLSRFPNEPRLAQLQQSLSRKLQEVRRNDLDELRRVGQETPGSSDAETIADATRRVDGIVARYEGDAEVQKAASLLRRRLETIVVAAPPAGTAPPPAAIPAVPPAPPGAEAQPPNVAEAGPPAPPAQPPVGSPGAMQAGPTGPPKKKPRSWIAVGALAGLLAVSIPLVWLIQKQKQKPATNQSAAGTLSVGAAPAGARVFVDGQERGVANPNLELKLAAGTHELEARLAGYGTVRQQLEVKAGAHVPLNLAFTPSVILRLSGPVGLKASIDGGAAVGMPGGELVRELTAEKHSVKIWNGRGSELEFSFEVAPTGLPVFLAPPRNKEFNALLVSNFGDQTHIVAAAQGVRVKVNGKPAGMLGKEGLDLPNLPAGTQRIELGEGNERRTKSIETGAGRTLSVLIDAEANTGNVIVETGLGDVHVAFLRSGKAVLEVTTEADGKFRVVGLPALTYDVQVSKPGFEADAARKTVKILKGQDQTVAFQLRKKAVFASVLVRTSPGARVFVDGKESGTTPENGLLQIQNLAVGEHKIEAQLKQFAPKSITATLKEGSGNPEVALQLSDRLRASVTILRTPGSRLSYRQQSTLGEMPVMEKEGRLTLSLPEGRYTFRARLENQQDVMKDVTLAAGDTSTLDLQNPVAKVEQQGLKDPMDAAWGKGAWQLEGDTGWYVRKTAGWLAFPRTPFYGVVTFTPALSSGGKIGRMFGLGKEKLEWRLDFVNEKNYLDFILKEGSFESSEVIEGKRSVHAKVKGVRLNKDNSPNIQIIVTPAGIEHRVNGQTIDKWDRAGSGAGSFGFMVEPNKPLLLQNDFRFEPSH